MRVVAVTALVAIALLTACQADETVALTVGDHTFQVEIADTPELRERGLMFRTDLDPDGGMLFVFDDDRPRSFWMKNTMIPLSIAYISANGRILEIHDMEPQSLAPVRSRYPARYALEVNQGRFSEVGVAVGDTVDLSVLSRRR
jgi:uncharacterized protein